MAFFRTVTLSPTSCILYYSSSPLGSPRMVAWNLRSLMKQPAGTESHGRVLPLSVLLLPFFPPRHHIDFIFTEQRQGLGKYFPTDLPPSAETSYLRWSTCVSHAISSLFLYILPSSMSREQNPNSFFFPNTFLRVSFLCSPGFWQFLFNLTLFRV